MGAGTAAGVAAEAPERIRSIVLEDPGWRDADPIPATGVAAASGQGSRAPLGSPSWREWNQTYKSLSAEERRAQTAIERPEWAEIDRMYWADAKALLNHGVFKEQNAPRPPWREIVRRITCPVLLLTADPERGAIVTAEAAKEASALWRTGRVVHIPGAGHNIRREQYEPFRAAVVAFLSETASL